MRVLWLSPIVPPTYKDALGDAAYKGPGVGWIEALRYSLADRADLELGIACITETPFESFERDGITFFALHHPATSTRAGRLVLRATHRDRSLDYTSRCMAAIDAYRPDVIHVHGTESTMGLVAGLTGIPTLVSLQGILQFYVPHLFDGISTADIVRDAIRPRSFLRGVGLVPKYLALRNCVDSERKIFETAHFFTGRTAFDREAVTRVNPTARYFHCDRILRPEFYETYQEPRPAGLVIYSTGSSAPPKGIGLLLEAVGDLVQSGLKDVTLRVSGDVEGSPIWPILRKRIEQLGLEDRVSWLGTLDAAAVRRELQSCSVYVHPSYMDNSPNALAEAMMCGTACVASTAGGIPSMLRSGVDGLLFESGNVTDLSAALRLVLKDEELRSRLGEAARRTAEERHDPARIASVTMDTYTTMLAEA